MDVLGIPISDFITQLLGIVVIDLVLGADNAIVIGMACRNLPDRLRMKGIVLGTVGAVALRVVATIVIVSLMKLNFVMLIGGIALIFIGCKLLIKDDDDKEVNAANSLLKAIITIIAADAIMGIDNILGVAGVAHGHPIMVVIGLCISVPVMVLGSTLIMKLMDKFSWIIYIGAAVILYTAGTMIVDDKMTAPWFEEHMVIRWALIIAITAGGLLVGYLFNRRKTGKA